jgi:hypothetical protein
LVFGGIVGGRITEENWKKNLEDKTKEVSDK